MKKYVIRMLCFGLVFTLVFIKVQDVLHYRWSNSEDLYTRNVDYIKQPENSIDILCFGTSELYAGYDPIVTYHEAGITGYNFATSWKSAVTVYYQLLFALQYQNPTVVMCDFSSLYDDELPNEMERLYRKIVDTMPDRKIKSKLIREICSLDSNQSYLSWKYPLLRYHSMWNELDEDNFTEDYVYDKEYLSYKKGAEMLNAPYDDGGMQFEITPGLWSYDNAHTLFSEVSVKYYDMFIQECQARQIHVVALLSPKIYSASTYAARWDAMKEYFDSRGVDYLNYNTYEQVMRMGVSLEDDYYDASHLNIYGSIKFSTIIADDLSIKYKFEDRRLENGIANEWNVAYDKFQEYLNSINSEEYVN